MPNSNRNKNSIKGNEEEDRTGAKKQTGYRKLPDDPSNPPDKSMSTADDTSDGVYSRTRKRKEDIDKSTTRGGR
jgi:hypothetical protein